MIGEVCECEMWQTVQADAVVVLKCSDRVLLALEEDVGGAERSARAVIVHGGLSDLTELLEEAL